MTAKRSSVQRKINRGDTAEKKVASFFRKNRVDRGPHIFFLNRALLRLNLALSDGPRAIAQMPMASPAPEQ